MGGGLTKGLAATALLWASGAAAEVPAPLSTYMLMTGGGPVARAVMAAGDACPVLTLDGRQMAMAVRAEPADLPLRPTRSMAENSKPSRFPVRVCEAAVPATARAVRIGTRALPVPRRTARRIVVIGDTGCRIMASDNAYQACNDPRAWPFARIAAQAAAWKPDLVVHVGDYLYRENPCAGHAGCTDTPWGYGWDAWDADFFTPAAPLLEAAPWLMIRGNHESCLRAGQGWWRLLAAQPLEAGRDCNDAASDARGDDSPPFAVPLGGGAQIIAMDLVIMGEDEIPPGDPRYTQIRSIQRAIAAMAKGHSFTFAADHYPLLGLNASDKKGTLRIKPGYEAVRSTFGIDDPTLRLPGIDALLAGHVHAWQQDDYGPGHPGQWISGMAGTQEGVTPIPAGRALDQEPAPGAKLLRFDSWTGGFGFMTLERTGRRRWRVELHALEGGVIRRCTIVGRRSACPR